MALTGRLDPPLLILPVHAVSLSSSSTQTTCLRSLLVLAKSLELVYVYVKISDADNG